MLSPPLSPVSDDHPVPPIEGGAVPRAAALDPRAAALDVDAPLEDADGAYDDDTRHRSSPLPPISL